MAWQCAVCGLEWHERIPPPICPRCGKIETYDRPTEHKRATAVALIPDIDLPRIPTGEDDVDKMLMGGFIEGSRVLLWGRGGTGKSRLAMRWGTGSVNCLYISLEMYEPIAGHAARSAGANPARIFITESYDRFGRKARECYARIVVLDSISVIPRHLQKDLLSELTTWAERRNNVVIVICHQNKRGVHAGSHAIQHWADTEIFLRHSKSGAVIAEVLKSRGCPVGQCKTVLGDNDSDSNSNEENSNISPPRGRLKAI